VKRLEFDFCVPGTHPSLPGHFPGNPIVPGVLLLDHVLVTLQNATRRRVSCLQQVKFMSALRPEEQAHAMCDIEEERASFRVTAQRNGAAVTLAGGSLSFQTGQGAAS
jgi:3-hydroxymyristoyl/3-hydroxydecanoyl-(acyl carrier protein) dehydratase